MATYAIGDIQGCYQTLQKLLKQIGFDPEIDKLWLAGDLINRGPDSLKTLEFIYQHKQSIQCVLGNHDLHFLAIALGPNQASKKDTFIELFDSPTLDTLVQWLREQPLFIYEPDLNFAMVHAGLPVDWTIEQSLKYSSEVSDYIQSDQAEKFFEQMYGDQPDKWSESLKGIDRLRYITNALTRMRYCYSDGKLELKQKCIPGKQPASLVPWFNLKAEQLDCNLVFGHWASLQGQCEPSNLFALDTGCVWGAQLTALRLEDKQRFSCDSVEKNS